MRDIQNLIRERIRISGNAKLALRSFLAGSDCIGRTRKDMIPEFVEMLNQMKEIHEKKNADYAKVGSPFENFERSAEIASWFDYEEDKSFTVLIGTKLARLATLLNSGKSPNNESVEDSFKDLATYCVLWASYHKQIAVKKAKNT